MGLVLEVLKNIGIVVGGTILVWLAILAVVLPLTFLVDAIKGPGRRKKPTGPSQYGRLRGRMQRAAQPTLLLTPTKEPGFSKLGGDPELPTGAPWPLQDNRPRTFVAQIDLAALRCHGGPHWVPERGRLYAFVDETRNGFADLIEVRYATDPPGPALSPPPGAGHFPERRVDFEAYPSIPSLDWLGVDWSDMVLDDHELDELSGAPDEAFGDELQHRIGGYPSEIQEDRMHVSCELLRRGLPRPYEGGEVTDAILRAARQWRLLLQVDSDPGLKMNWGDGGRLYVFIRERDSLAGDFSRTVTLSQTY